MIHVIKRTATTRTVLNSNQRNIFTLPSRDGTKDKLETCFIRAAVLLSFLFKFCECCKAIAMVFPSHNPDILAMRLYVSNIIELTIMMHSYHTILCNT